MADPMRIRAKVNGDKVNVSLLISHEMESGQRRGSDGKLVPAWFIQTLSSSYQGRVVMSAQWGPSVSKNPLTQFSFKGGKAGEKITVTWVDNHGDTRTDEAVIA